MEERTGKRFIPAGEVPWEDLGEGLSRKIMGWDNRVMMVAVKFEKGAVGTPHHHPHSQVTYVVKGVFEFTVDGETRTVGKGDGVHIPPHVLHGAICLEEGELIDVFSPLREDFL